MSGALYRCASCHLHHDSDDPEYWVQDGETEAMVRVCEQCWSYWRNLLDSLEYGYSVHERVLTIE